MTSDDTQLASQGRRLAGFVLDGFLIVVTLFIGWVIWYLVVAGNGQSPAKRLLGIRVIRGDGHTAGLGWMLIRDWAVRTFAFGTVNVALVVVLGQGVGDAIGLLFFSLAALWCVWDTNRQCLWDKIVGTRVVRVAARERTAATWKQLMDTACPVCGMESEYCIGPDGRRLIISFHLERRAKAEARVGPRGPRLELGRERVWFLVKAAYKSPRR